MQSAKELAPYQGALVLRPEARCEPLRMWTEAHAKLGRRPDDLRSLSARASLARHILLRHKRQ
jgi:hypothetical protein